MKKLVMLTFFACATLQPLCAPQTEANPGLRFTTVDIFLDSQQQTLAAYQLEWKCDSSDARIVGVEGGENPAFSGAPYYDPKAMQHERVILGAFSTAKAEALPKGKTRIATIHVQISGGDALKSTLINTTAAGPDGQVIKVDAASIERKTE